MHLYRNESLIQMESFETDVNRADALIASLRNKWAKLRELGFAGDYPIEILRSGKAHRHSNGNGHSNGNDSSTVKIVEIFKWRSQQERVNALRSPEYQALLGEVTAMAASCAECESYSEVVRGFNTNFPAIGGVELLKGVCSCLLSIDGMVENYPMSVKNGIVLMHRSPRMDLDGDGNNEMYLKILMHGGELIQAALGPIRVEQNFNRPNDGLVRSNGTGTNDFPATAVWRVSWKIQTPLGAVLTDPEQPLIFGPATVNHYPPVGTHFHSPTGPVKLVLEQTGERIGTLIPGELTAFDIVVTKDDEIFADHLNAPPEDLFRVLDEYSAHMEEYSSRHITVPAP